MREKLQSHCDLEVYRLAFDTAMRLFTFSRDFPKEEKVLATDQMRRSSRSISANLAEAWRKRRYLGEFPL